MPLTHWLLRWVTTSFCLECHYSVIPVDEPILVVLISFFISFLVVNFFLGKRRKIKSSFLGKNMASISINGNTYTGNSINISGSKITIDGVVQECDDKKINIVVNGNIEMLDVDICDELHVTGDVNKSVTSTNGSIRVGGNVGGDVKTTNGSVRVAGSISGGVKTTNGSITGIG